MIYIKRITHYTLMIPKRRGTLSNKCINCVSKTNYVARSTFVGSSNCLTDCKYKKFHIGPFVICVYE